MGAVDFAGGIVVHINAGMAALAAVIVLGRRKGFPDSISPWLRNRSSDHPVYPKYFRFNSKTTCRQVLFETGFSVTTLKLIEKEPSYGMRSPLLFLPMMVYERIVNSSALFQSLRANILCAAKKP